MSEQTKEERALEALIALALRQGQADPTDEEVLQFITECRDGLHPLSQEDEAALKAATKQPF